MAPSHKTYITQEPMSDILYDHVTSNLWPPKLQDLNPIDHFVWNVLEKDTTWYIPNIIESLKNTNVQMIYKRNKEHLMLAFQQFLFHNITTIEAECKFREWFYKKSEELVRKIFIKTF